MWKCLCFSSEFWACDIICSGGKENILKNIVCDLK